jgi:hypothetical protein
MRIGMALCAVFLAFSSFATSVTVGCPGGPPGDYASIAAALTALDLDGPHDIFISGTCTETVVMTDRERITFHGPATVIGAGTQPAFVIRSGHALTLRDNLVTRGLSAAISIGNNAEVTLRGVTAENSNNFALDVFGGASVSLGGPGILDAVTLRNSVGGMRCESCIAFLGGFVTIENHTGAGLVIEGGRVEGFGQRPASPSGPVQGGPILIRNNALNGVSVSNRGVFELARLNSIQNNGLSGIILNDGSANLIGSFTPDGTPMGTTIEGNQRNAASVLFNSTLRAQGPNVFQNNGNASVPFSGGISATHSSMVFLTGGSITGSVGPGVALDSLSTLRLDAMSISGNSAEAVRLLHGSLLESIANNTIPALSVTCDGTSIVFGDFAGVAPFECEKDKKK